MHPLLLDPIRLFFIIWPKNLQLELELQQLQLKKKTFLFIFEKSFYSTISS